MGIDSNSGVYRYTFDLLHLSDGIPFIVVVIGLFAVSELMLMLQAHHGDVQPVEVTGRTMFNAKEFMLARWTILRSSVVGFFVGVLPGAGASIASAMTYSMERRMAGKDHCLVRATCAAWRRPRRQQRFGLWLADSHADPRCAGFGYHRGDDQGAHALQHHPGSDPVPGPAGDRLGPDRLAGDLQRDAGADEHPLVKLFVKFLQIPNWVLVPGVAAVSMVGVYAVHGTTFDLIVGTLLGGFGYLLRVMNFPMAPFILGFVLGDMMEQNLRRALSISNGELEILFASPISIGLWLAAIAMLIGPRLAKAIDARRNPAPAA